MQRQFMQTLVEIIDQIKKEQTIQREQLQALLETTDEQAVSYLRDTARKVADDIYGKQVFIRGLIEFTNYCKNDCIYCGIRRSNPNAQRYRLTEEEILSCCANGYELGFRTFVLQGGEDPYFTDERICNIVAKIKQDYPDCAVTLSIGEKDKVSYQAFYDAGAEGFYHGLVLGLIALMDNQYKIKSNRESGDGRYDISLIPREKKYPGIIMELKWKSNLDERSLEKLAKEALMQIDDKRYDAEMQQGGIKRILKLGIAFSGKRVKIQMR